MGLLQKIFGKGEGANGARRGGDSSQFHESDTTNEEEGSRNAPRRELVQVILRDTMRKHGIPSDWIDCRILAAVSRTGRTGLHVNFVVKEAHERLLGYVFAFQDSFEKELTRFEPRSKDWLMAIGWEFRNHNLGGTVMPDPLSWSRAGEHAPLTAPGSNAALRSADNARAFAPTVDPRELELPKTDEDMQRDLQALFAIRDQALADAAGKPRPELEPTRPEFEPTQPFQDSGGQQQR
jgi:hypothetical protein